MTLTNFHPYFGLFWFGGMSPSMIKIMGRHAYWDFMGWLAVPCKPFPYHSPWVTLQQGLFWSNRSGVCEQQQVSCSFYYSFLGSFIWAAGRKSLWECFQLGSLIHSFLVCFLLLDAVRKYLTESIEGKGVFLRRNDRVHGDRKEWWQECQAADHTAPTVKQRELNNHFRTFLSSEHVDPNVHRESLLKENRRKKWGWRDGSVDKAFAERSGV